MYNSPAASYTFVYHQGRVAPLYLITRQRASFLRHTESGDPVTNLSESEQKLFGYLCFLWNAEFWRGYEEMRNLHGIRKPLLVLNFAECLDESIDMDALLQRTEALGRQVILIEAGNREP